MLIARIYEVFPLLCTLCVGQMRLIAFFTEGTQTSKIRKILKHIFAERGPPLWQDCGDTQVGEGVKGELDWDVAAQLALDYEADRRVHGWLLEAAIQIRCGMGLRALRVKITLHLKVTPLGRCDSLLQTGPRLLGSPIRVAFLPLRVESPICTSVECDSSNRPVRVTDRQGQVSTMAYT